MIGKLQKLQNREAKLITNSPVIRARGWSTVREMIDLESAGIVYKSLNGDAPSYMSDIFIKVNVSRTPSLRNSDYDLRVPLRGEWPSGLKSSRLFTEVKLGRVIYAILPIICAFEEAGVRPLKSPGTGMIWRQDSILVRALVKLVRAEFLI